MIMQIKSFALGFLLCVLISLSSLYSAMRMGVLAWPTLFVSLLCYSVLSVTGKKKVDMKEVTLAHTLASSGSMVAGAIAYTLPGFWIANNTSSNLELWKVLVVSVIGVFIGTFCTSFYKKSLIDRENLDYPIGKATYLALNEANSKKSNKKLLVLPGCISAGFAALRDGFKLIPGLITITPKIQIWPSLMALSIGALLTPKVVLLLFSSAVISQFIVFPNIEVWDIHYFECIRSQIEAIGSNEAPLEFIKRNLAFGLMLGSGIGVFLKSTINRFSAKNTKKLKNKKANNLSLIRLAIFALCAIGYVISSKISIISSIILIIAMFVSTYLSARLTGESGINPMEVFAYISFIIINLVRELNIPQGFLILISVTVACGLTGDIMNDFKSGVGFKVDEKEQSVSEFIGAILGVAVSVFAVYYLKNKGAEFGGEQFPVFQAKMLGENLKNGSSPLFIVALLISTLITFLGANGAIIGLGIYLPFYITLMISAGCFISILVPKKYKSVTPIIASGALVGDGVVAMIISFFSFRG